MSVTLGVLLPLSRSTAEQYTTPVTYHLAFDNTEFLKDDYSARVPDPPFAERGLGFVPGRFGQALLNDNDFVEADFEKTYMSVRDLDLLLLADLAVDGVRTTSGVLRARVSNFGTARVPSVMVHLEDAAGRSIAQETVSDLESAQDGTECQEPALILAPGLTDSRAGSGLSEGQGIADFFRVSACATIISEGVSFLSEFRG